MVLSPGEWLARFADDGRAQIEAEHERIGAKIHAAPEIEAQPTIVVLERAHQIEPDDPRVPTAARVLCAAALSLGWAARVLLSVAADPARGLLVCVTVRCARHDERLIAAWLNGRFDSGQYLRSGAALESLAADRAKAALFAGGAMAIEGFTAARLRELARERGVKIPSTAKKAEIIERLRAVGVSSGAIVPPRRGLLDAIEGLHLTRQSVMSPS